MRVRSNLIVAALALLALVLGIGYGLRLEMQPVPEPAPAESVAFGVYDPSHRFFDALNISIEHIFVSWQSPLADLRRSIQQADDRKRQLLVTIEPWTDAADRVTGGEELFGDILAGDYDSRIEGICAEFADVDTPVLARWAHEMEDPTGRYPWARTDADGYKRAFRRFVEVCRSAAPAARFIWSPKGETNLDQYYPGDAYVDYVGLSIYTLQAWDLDRYGKNRTFGDLVAEKYQRVAHYGKPVIIAEFAVFGDKAYLEHFFSDFRQSLSDFPALVALVYFNDKEPHYWPDGYGSPDWRVMTDHYFRLTTAAGVHS